MWLEQEACPRKALHLLQAQFLVRCIRHHQGRRIAQSIGDTP
jgi:hypothetical protein